MAVIGTLTTFSSGTLIQSAQVNANFEAIRAAFDNTAVLTDTAQTIAAVKTFAADVLFVDALYDIGKSGATRPRDGFFSRNLTAGGILAGVSLVLSGALSGATSGAFSGAVVVGSIASNGRVNTLGPAVTAHAWDATFASVLQLASGAAMTGSSDADLRLVQGLYYNAGWKYSGGGTVPSSYLDLGSGELVFATAPGGALDGAATLTNRFQVSSGGQVLIGTTVTTGASAGDVITASNRGLRGVSAAGTTSYNLVKVSGNDIITVGDAGLGTPVAFPSFAAAGFPNAAAVNNGGIWVDTTNNRLVYHANGSRFYLTGTSF